MICTQHHRRKKQIWNKFFQTNDKKLIRIYTYTFDDSEFIEIRIRCNNSLNPVPKTQETIWQELSVGKLSKQSLRREDDPRWW